jgi:hypothetical protein
MFGKYPVLILVAVVILASCQGSNLIQHPRTWKFVFITYRQTQILGWPEARIPPYVNDGDEAARLLKSWLSQYSVVIDSVYTDIPVQKVTKYGTNSLCKTEYYALGPGDAPTPPGYHAYVGLWAPPAGMPTCAYGWAWFGPSWAQVYYLALPRTYEGLIHELAHLVEWYAKRLGYIVVSPDDATRLGYMCEPVTDGCTWLRFLKDYFTGAFDGAIPKQFWQNRQ